MFFRTLALAALSSATAVLSLATPLAPVAARSNSLVERTNSDYKMVIYSDDYISGETGLPSANDLAGYNVLILAFLLIKGPADQAEQWKMLSDSQRTTLKSQYKAAGITLMVSAFGSTETPTTDGVDAATIAKTHAAYVKQYDFDGIDVDYEDMGAINKGNGKAEQWLITYTQTLRNELPSGQYYITHAPVAPWFSKPTYPAGAYAKVHEEAGDLIDWYNLQFYNQGDTEYTTCSGLLTKSSNVFPQSSLFEINQYAGVPLSKLVIGKPSAAYQADNGFVSFSTLATCIAEAGEKGWSAGTMLWEYETSLSSDVSSVLAKALAAIRGGGGIPILSTGTSSTHTATSTKGVATSTGTASTTKTATITKAHAKTTSTTSAPSSTTSSPSDVTTGGSCNGVPAWDSSKVYGGGSEVTTGTTVSYNGFEWTNKWWTQGDTPGSGGDSDPWTQIKACSSSKRDVDADVLAVRREQLKANITSAKRNLHNKNNKMRRVHVNRLNDLS